MFFNVSDLAIPRICPLTTTTLGATTVTAGFGNNVTFTGGAGNDTISVGATTKAITLGAGTNKVYMVSGTTALGTGGSITATTGTSDTLYMVNADAAALTTTAATGAAFKAAVTGFETFNIGTAGATTVSMTDGGSFSTLALTTAAVTQTVNNWSTGKTVELTYGATQTNLALSTMTGAADTVTIKLKGDLSAAANVFGTVSPAGAETVTITTVDSNTTFTARLQSLTVVDTVASSIILTGNNGVALTAASTAITNFDASGITTGGVTFTSGVLPTDVTVKGSLTGNDTLNFSAATAIVTITETAGTNTLTGSATIGSFITGGSGIDTITGGAGDDTIVVGAGITTNSVTGAAGADSIDLTGSSGADTIIYGVASTTVDAAGANMDTITNFASGTDKIQLTAGDNSATAGTISVGGLAGINLAAGSTLATMAAVISDATSVATVADVYTALGVVLTTANLTASATGVGNIKGQVVTFTTGAAAGTYLVINDVTADFQAATDLVIKLAGTTTFAAGDLTVV